MSGYLALSLMTLSIPSQNQNVPIGNADRIFCSSVKISSNKLLTAKHCVKEESEQLFAYCGKTKVPLTVMARDENADIALVALESECENAAITPLGVRTPAPGSDVFVIGCPMGKCGMITKGVISNYVYIGGQSFVITDAKAYFGNSGGGLFDGTTLVGIASQLIVYNHNDVPISYSAFVPLRVIKQFLQGVLQNACPNF